MSKVSINADDLKALAQRSMTLGTQDAWIAIALEWIEVADKRISELSAASSTPPEVETPLDGVIETARNVIASYKEQRVYANGIAASSTEIILAREVLRLSKEKA